MRDILSNVERWLAEGKQVALATVVQTWGSSPRRVGSKMAVSSDVQFSGSVSGGCVENAVIEAAGEVMKSGQAQLLHFGVADETAWEVGLACGGSIEVFVRSLDPGFYPALREAYTDEGTHSVHGTVIRGSAELLGDEYLLREGGIVTGYHEIFANAFPLVQETLAQRASRRVVLDESTELFLEFIAPPPTLVAVGGVHITVALVSLAKRLGFKTIVVDPRSAWGNEERFPDVDELIQAWPQAAFQRVKLTRSSAVIMLTHDPKLDDPAVTIALNSPAFYVGALGSKTTQAKRRERLLREGIIESRLSRLHAPIGLDIGAETPEEIALAILAEVVLAYRRPHLFETIEEPEAISSHRSPAPASKANP
jgi:xanthine dehydrogenase accessory factor